MRTTPRILLALALAAGCGGCAFFGSLVHGGSVGVGAAAGGALGGPAGAAVGGVAGFYAGDLAAEQVTGTRAVRVGADGKIPEPAGASGSLTGTITQAAGVPSMDTLIWIVAIVAFFALGGPAWALKKIRDARREDAEWTDALAKDRVEHRAETAALRAEIEQMKKDAAAKRKR